MQPVGIIIFDPQCIASRDADEIKTPIGDPAEIVFMKIPVGMGSESIE